MKQSLVLTALIVLLIVPLAWASTAKASEITEQNKAAFSQEHYDLLIKSSKEENDCTLWNDWRKENPGVKIELAKANLSKTSLGQANLSEAVLTEANLEMADLWKANLEKSLLMRANLKQAFVGKANFLPDARWGKQIP